MVKFFKDTNPRYLKFKMTPVSLESTHIDWKRKAAKLGRVYINGRDLHTLARKYNHLETPSDLQNLWQKEIFLQIEPKWSASQRHAMAKYFEHYFNQNGSLGLLQTALAAQLVLMNYVLDAKHADKFIEINTKRGQIIINETVAVKQLRSLEDAEIVLHAKRPNSAPLISAELKQAVSINIRNYIPHEIRKVQLSYENEKMHRLFDNFARGRSLRQRINDYFHTNTIATTLVAPFRRRPKR